MAYKQPANSQGEFRIWAFNLEDIYARVNGLESIYTRLLKHASQAKDLLSRGENVEKTLTEMQQLLNMTLPVDDTDRVLSSFMTFLANCKRGELIGFLFKIRKACLLLIVDGKTAAKALGVANVLDICLDDQLRFRVTPCGALPDESQIQETSELRPRASNESHLRASDERRPRAADERRPRTSDERRPRTSDERRPRTSDERRPRASDDRRPRASDERRGRRHGKNWEEPQCKPVMSMEEYQKVLTELAEAEEEFVATAKPAIPAEAATTSTDKKEVSTSWLDDEELEELLAPTKD